MNQELVSAAPLFVVQREKPESSWGTAREAWEKESPQTWEQPFVCDREWPDLNCIGNAAQSPWPQATSSVMQGGGAGRRFTGEICEYRGSQVVTGTLLELRGVQPDPAALILNHQDGDLFSQSLLEVEEETMDIRAGGPLRARGPSI